MAVLALGPIGLGVWTGRLHLVLLPLLVAFLGVAAYRYLACRREDWMRLEVAGGRAWPRGAWKSG